MISLGATAAVIESGQVLLAKREDFEVWCLPGGMVEAGESLPQAAVREAREETGLDIELLRLAGLYYRLGGVVDSHLACFVARSLGGSLNPQPGEVLELRYFSPAALPDDMFWWHRQQVADAFNPSGGSPVRTFTVKPAEKIGSRQELYALRDRSGLSRPDFYRYYFERGGTNTEELEVDGAP